MIDDHDEVLEADETNNVLVAPFTVVEPLPVYHWVGVTAVERYMGRVDGLEAFPDGQVQEGTTITLTPVPRPGYVFDHWEGDATGSADPLEIVVEQSLYVEAHFVVAPTPGA